MKMMIAAALVLLSASSVLAARDCASLGGTCKYSCQATEFKEDGFFRDCDYRKVCCLTEKKATPGQEQRRDGEKEVSDAPKTVSATGGSAGKTVSDEKGGGARSGTVNQLLVCSPVKEAFASSDTLLQCGSRNTTLGALYEENYRLIQILNSSKVLYYLEKKALR